MTTTNKYEPGTICWVDMVSTDPEKSRDFFKALFNWTFTVGGPESGYYAMAKLGEDSVAAVVGLPPGRHMPSTWTAYFATADLDATLARVKESSGNVLIGPMDIMEEGRMGLCTDPTGATFGLWQPKRHIGAQRVDEPGAMAWHECVTGEPAKARDFYAKVFGLEAQRLGGEMEYYTLHKGPKTVGGVNPSKKPPHWSTYFQVSDVDASVKKVAELGGTVFSPPFDTPYGRLAFVAEPTGAAFALMTPPKK